MIKVGIVGAGGYAGINLVQILLNHPEAEIAWVMSEEAHKGKKVTELYPYLTGRIDLSFETLADFEKRLGVVDLVFLALPHAIAMDYVPKALSAGKKVIDLGADYRFNDVSVFEKWYHTKHTSPDLCREAVFGLPELYRKEIKKARLVGNPGCYPTASTLALAPLVKAKLIEEDSMIVDAKSGISGAGRGVSLKTHFCERDEGIEAYAVTNHRHMGEIEYQISRISALNQNGSGAGHQISVTFVPHLVPMNRGILATCYANLKKDVAARLGRALPALYKDFYKNEPFVKVLEGVVPNTKFVSGTNYCFIAVDYNECTGKVIILSAIDNLIKGAAGQAVQNMNLMYGFEEKTALDQIAVFP